MIKTNWLISALQKEARRFRADDQVRFFTDKRKGKGKDIVLTPSFLRGRIMEYDNYQRRYKVWDEKNEQEVFVHPRNLVPSSVSAPPKSMESVESVEPLPVVETETPMI